MNKCSATYWINRAYKENWALGMFNAHHLESFHAISTAANNTKSPLMISTTMGGIKHVGLNYFVKMAEAARKKSSVPLILHLDHGANYEIICECIEAGFDSVMIDASFKTYDENVEIVRKIVKFAHKNNVGVEAQIGETLAEEGEHELIERKTSEEEACKFVADTGVDYLAVSIGSKPGQFNLIPEVDIPLLSAISKSVNIPLVLHGGSGVPKEIVKQAIKNGISKINIDAAIKNAFRKAFINNYNVSNPIMDTRIPLAEARNNAQIVVEKLLKVFGSNNRV
jgi:ketose-bisphosphate aldolase